MVHAKRGLQMPALVDPGFDLFLSSCSFPFPPTDIHGLTNSFEPRNDTKTGPAPCAFVVLIHRYAWPIFFGQTDPNNSALRVISWFQFLSIGASGANYETIRLAESYSIN